MSIRYVIRAVPRTKKNHQNIYYNKKTREPFIAQNHRYLEYERLCGYQIRRPPEPINYPVNVKEVFYMDNDRRVDLTNLQAAMDDILVKFGVLKDDNSKIIVTHDGSRVFVDRENPRIEITITRIEL